METKTEFKTIKAMVEDLLKNDIKARNDDKWLTYRVMRNFTNIYIPFADFEKIPAFETIKRVRAIIQNKEKRFLPTESDVIARRTKRQQEIGTFIGERKW